LSDSLSHGEREGAAQRREGEGPQGALHRLIALTLPRLGAPSLSQGERESGIPRAGRDNDIAGVTI